MMRQIFLISLFCLLCTQLYSQLTLRFPSVDGLSITADWYPVNSNAPIVLLCHQNQYSRGEFLETAPRLNKFGFNCLAIDLRVGETVNGIMNETAANAKAKGANPTFAAAEQDIVAAIDFLYDKYKKRIILLGSSYSASLALKIAATNNKILGVAAFSPGEYFDDPEFIARHINGLDKPVLLTSNRDESEQVTELTKDVVSILKVQFIPKGKGEHGSKALWASKNENQDYWAALMSFLNRLKKEEQKNFSKD